MVSIWNGFDSGWCIFVIVSIQVGVHLGLRPFGIVYRIPLRYMPTSGVQSGLYLGGINPNRSFLTKLFSSNGLHTVMGLISLRSANKVSTKKNLPIYFRRVLSS